MNVQRIDSVCPRHPERVMILDACPGCLEEKFGPIEGCDEEGTTREEVMFQTDPARADAAPQ